jgi:sortase (surface protein transpeptidase)
MVKIGSRLLVLFTPLNELKAAFKVIAQTGQSGAVNKTSVVSTAQDDDFREVTRCKRYISNDTSQTAKKLTK